MFSLDYTFHPSRAIFNLHRFPLSEYQWNIPVSLLSYLKPWPLPGLPNNPYHNPTIPNLNSVQIQRSIFLISLHSWVEVISCKTTSSFLLGTLHHIYTVCLHLSQTIPFSPGSCTFPFSSLYWKHSFQKEYITRIVTVNLLSSFKVKLPW